MARLDRNSKIHRETLIGKKYNRLKAVRYAGKNARLDAYWEFECDCGASVVVCGKNVRSGSTKSCGCLNREMAKETIPLESRKRTCWSKVRKRKKGCWEWTGRLSPQGYGVFSYN